MSADTAIQALGLAVGFFLGMILHEYAHARASDALGDKTPRLYGRLTLNPKAHVDPLGTLILPGIFILSVLVGSPFGLMFGYAKPVPTNPHRLRSPRNHAVAVALAGPLTNLAIAAVAGFGFQSVVRGQGEALADVIARQGGVSLVDLSVTAQILYWVLVLNAFLFVLNALPIPPLDGSKVLARFLSPSAASKLEELGQYGLLFLLLFFIFEPLGDILRGLVEPIITTFGGL